MIGILTFQNTINYGAILQAYALQKKIDSFGAKSEIIQYECDAIQEREMPKALSSLRSVKGFFKYLLSDRAESRKRGRFHQFSQRYLTCSSEIYRKINIEKTVQLYDSFVVGSDQIWNLELTGEDYTYFLDFESDCRKKKAYAGSFGYETIPDQYKTNCAQYLADFSVLTVRENTGQKNIDGLLEKKVSVVLDPTLLLTEKEWDPIIDFHPKIGKYILVYFIHNKRETFKFARSLAKRTGYKLVYINISPKPGIGMKNIRYASPGEFLGWIKHAQYIITGSFHGVSFSINFNKKFFFEINRHPNAFNSRILSLISILGLEERELGALGDVEKEMDYSTVNAKLNGLRRDSLFQLQRMAGG